MTLARLVEIMVGVNVVLCCILMGSYINTDRHWKYPSSMAWRWVPCDSCKGKPRSVASWSDPHGCWDCRNIGKTPVHRWTWLARKVGPREPWRTRR